MYTNTFRTAPNGLDPARIPFKILPNGDQIPGIGLGTFGSDRFSGEQIAEAVREAILLGYRHIDCASVYGNEHIIGPVLEDLIRRGLNRKELWITSKLWNNMHGEGQVIESCKKSLNDLKLKYLDLYLVHWPFPNHHAAGVTVDSRDPGAVPYIHENYMKTWQQMEQLVDMGLVRNIGTSNMTIPKLRLLLRDARIKPACNEMELHPHFQQPELFNYLINNEIVPIGFSPIGSPARPERDRTPEDTVDIEDPVIVLIARRLNVHPAVVCIKWAVQRGQVPIPFSTKRKNILSNLECLISEPLSEEEMKEIAGIDKNCRLIKGQVFLWESAKGWEDLWDPDGVINGSE
ncbi:MAG: aldo/keto reductase [Bacteroidales bacterium]|nr:aldo/keto reductase [Bacteroidales bacterium]